MTNATPTGSVCPLRRPPKGKDHPSASRTAFFGLPPDSRNPSSPQPSRLLDSPHHHADVGLADEKSGLSLAATRSATPPWDRLRKPAAPAETPPVRPPQSGFRPHPHRSPDLSMRRRTTGWKQVARGASPLRTRSRFPRQLDPAHPVRRTWP